MSVKTLVESYSQRTDKYDLGYIDEFYDSIFSKVKDNVKNVLEVGIYAGESIKLWHDYFTDATIYCVDINHCPAIENLNRVKQFTENAYSSSFLEKLTDTKFDVIIDDGPHTLESMEYFLNNYIKLLSEDGVLILEDIIYRPWTPELLKLVPKEYTVRVVDMRNKQKTAQLLNMWSGGLDVIIVSKNNY